jgi:C1A family cysteine protease
LRATLKAAAGFGVAPERYWPYDIARYDDEPSAFVYRSAEDYGELHYTRLDDVGLGPDTLLDDVKRTISGGLGVIFGITIYSSVSDAADIPLAGRSDSARGGHALMAVGYDDDHQLPDGTECGSLIVRNSWGPDWGIGGYGFLPYEYVTSGAACDFWTVLRKGWLTIGTESKPPTASAAASAAATAAVAPKRRLRKTASAPGRNSIRGKRG